MYKNHPLRKCLCCGHPLTITRKGTKWLAFCSVNGCNNAGVPIRGMPSALAINPQKANSYTQLVYKLNRAVKRFYNIKRTPYVNPHTTGVQWYGWGQIVWQGPHPCTNCAAMPGLRAMGTPIKTRG